ncbi:kinetochore-associated Ndc80 complex subunit nuf2 [Tieghemiomyces parasiticus]|uniref:Kinetochore-associated Ndc80 complex subunit nuf2 n=1 Tax=Tieghemiomyces parasiticus TaxID=78921 RepID=A0A9W7ZRV4_9FUNG|nr:kinetochore-associated Ndc80 complex subunit nuf2 [Tieghemiomyces parasiticus]
MLNYGSMTPRNGGGGLGAGGTVGGRAPYSFPALPPAEILQCMNDLQIPFTEEDLMKPTPQRMQVVYEAFVDIFMGITSDQFEDPKVELANLIEFPEIHADSTVLMTFYHHVQPGTIVSLLTLFTFYPWLFCTCNITSQFDLATTSRRLMHEVGIKDFSLREILRPEPGQVKRVLSAMINFAKFREERMAVYDKYVNQADDYAKRLSSLQQEQQELQEKISMIRHRQVQEQPQVVKLKDDNEKLHQENARITATYNVIKKDVNAIRDEYKELHEIVAKCQTEENELRNRINDLKSKIVQDPEKAKEELQEMNEVVTQSRHSLAGLEQKLRQLEIRIETMDAVEQELSASLRLQEDCQTEEHKVEESLQQITRDREQLEQRQIQFRELEMGQQRLRRQLDLAQDKSARLEKQRTMKMEGLLAKKKQLQADLGEASQEAEAAKEKITRSKRLTEEMEQRTTELRDNTEKELEAMLTDYLRLKDRVEMYQHKLLQLITPGRYPAQ